MPATSTSQQRAAAIALSAARGEIPKSKLKGASLQMFNSMTVKELKKFASTERKGLPKKKRKK